MKALANCEQGLSEEQKLQARTNIGAIGGVKVTDSSGTTELVPDANGKVTVDLTNAGKVQSDWDETNDVEPSYIRNKPNLSGFATKTELTEGLAGKQNTLTAGDNIVINGDTISATAEPQQQADWAQTDSSAVDYIKNKPTLATVATTGSYNDLTDKPSIPAAQVQSDWNQTDNTQVDYIKNKPAQMETKPLVAGTNMEFVSASDSVTINTTATKVVTRAYPYTTDVPLASMGIYNPGSTYGSVVQDGAGNTIGFLAPKHSGQPDVNKVLTVVDDDGFKLEWVDAQSGLFVALWDGVSGTKTTFSDVFQAYQAGKAVILKWKDGATAYDYAVLSKITLTYAVFTQLRANETASVPNNTHNAYTVLLKDDDSYTFQNVRLNVSAGANVNIADSQSSDTKEIAVPSVVKYDSPMMVDDYSTTEKYTPYWTVCGGHMQLRMHIRSMTGSNTDSVETICIKSPNSRPYYFNATFYSSDPSIAPYSVGQYVSDGSEVDSGSWNNTMGFSAGLVGYLANEKIVIDVWYAYKSNPSLSNDWRHAQITLMKNHDAQKIYGACEYDSDV